MCRGLRLTVADYGLRFHHSRADAGPYDYPQAHQGEQMSAGFLDSLTMPRQVASKLRLVTRYVARCHKREDPSVRSFFQPHLSTYR